MKRLIFVVAVIIVAAVVFNAGGKLGDKLDDIAFPTVANTTESAASSLEAATLVRVVDGDTIVVSQDGEEKKVRLIGVNTPESVHADESKNNEYGDMASEFTKELLADTKTVWLEYDVDKTDPYDRVLAYVWLSDDATEITNMLNMQLVTFGYAEDVVYEPNHKYAYDFEMACDKARENGVGLWAFEKFAKAA